jgi:hypothetical protein
MPCSGLHCGGCGSGKGAGAGLAVAVITGLVIYRAVTSPQVAHAADTALTVAVITVATVAALTVAAGLTVTGLAVRRAAVRRSAARAAVAPPPEPVRLVSVRTVRELAPPEALSVPRGRARDLLTRYLRPGR